MTETISIIYKPIQNSLGLVYHETLVYTNSNGQSFYCSAGFSNEAQAQQLGGLNELLNIPASEEAYISGIPSAFYGTLTTSGSTNVPFNPGDLTSAENITEDANGVPYLQLNVASASDLSSQWSSIVATYNAVNASDLAYAVLSQNSNSVATTALLNAGLAAPVTGALVPTPASDVPLPIVTAVGDNITSVASTSQLGDPVATIIDNTTGGKVVITGNGLGTSANLTASVNGVQTFSENASVTPNGAQSATIQGFNSDGSVKYGQTETQAVSGQISVNITGQGDVANLNGATVGFAAGTQATVDGTDNTLLVPNSNGQITATGSNSVSVDNSGQISVTPQSVGPITEIVVANAASATATIGNNSFSEAVANLKASVDAQGDVGFATNAGTPLQTLTPDASTGGVDQNLYSSSVIGQLTARNIFGANGALNGSEQFAYNGNTTVGTILNSSGQQIGTETINNTTGAGELQTDDPATSQQTSNTDLNANGQSTQQTTDTNDYAAFQKAIGDTLATQLISSVLIQNNLPATIAAQSFADAVIDSATKTGSGDFNTDFANSAFGIAGGIAGSEAGVELADALGIPSQAGSLVGGVGGNLVAQYLFNQAASKFGITTGSTLTTDNFVANFENGLASAGGAFVGSELANLITPTNTGGEITGAVATAATIALVFDDPLAAPFYEVFAVAFGSDFIGTLIGDLFGDLFGGQPSVGPDALALVYFDQGSQQFYTDSLQEDNGGSTAGVASIASALESATNDVLSAIGGTVVNSPAHLSIIMFEGSWYYVAGDVSPRAAGVGSTDPNAIVDGAAFDWLRSLQIQGGNAYMEYTLAASDATNLVGLVSDLNVARDYSLYVANPMAFDVGLAMANDPTRYAAWLTELTQAQALGLTSLSPQVLSAIEAGDPFYVANGNNLTISGSNEVAVVANAMVGLVPGVTGVTVQATNEIVDVSGAGALILTGSGNAINMATGSAVDTVTLEGTDNGINVNDSNSFVIDNDTGNEDFILVHNNNNTITSSNQNVVLDAGTSGTSVTGNANTINADGTAAFAVTGSDNTINSAVGGAVATITVNGGTGNTVNINDSNSTVTDTDSGDSIFVYNNGATVSASGDAINLNIGAGQALYGNNNTVSATVTGNDDTITAGANATLTVDGSSDTISAVSGDSISVAGSADVIVGSNDTVTVGAGTSGASLLGDGDTISVAKGETFDLTGSNGTINLGSNDILNINGGASDTVTATGNTINAAASVTMTLNGGGDTVNAAGGDMVTVTGVNQATDNVVVISGGTVNLSTGAEMDVYGNGDTVNAAEMSYLGTSGANEIVNTAGTGALIWVNSGSATINGSGNLIFAVSSDTLSLNGTGDTISLETIASSNASFSQSNNDLVVTGSGNTGHVTVQNYFLGSNEQPADIQFSDGVTRTEQYIDALFATHSSAQATIGGAPSVNLGNVRVGATDSTTLNISNSATGAAEKLDASIGGVTGGATASGSISQLAAGSTDAVDISVGLNSSSAGRQTGSVTLNFASDGTGIDLNGVTTLPSQTVQLSGSVYRVASASIASLPANPIVHVGDAVTENLSITNAAAADGYSEKLTAGVASTTAGITASGSTGDIAAQGTSSVIQVGISTAQAGVVSGSVTLNLASDGAGVDGLSPVSLAQQTLAVTATVNNYAHAAFEELSGGGTFTQNGNNYALTYNQAAGVSSSTFNLGVLNNVSGLSDLLAGSFTTSGPSSFSLSGLSNFSGLSAGQADTSPAITFNGTTPGSYTEIVTLHSSGSNASGYSASLADETLTIAVNVATSTPGQTESIAVFGQVINLSSLPNFGTLLGTGASFDGSGNQSHFTRNTTSGQLDISEFDSNGNITFAEALTNSGAAFTVASGTTVIDTAQNLLASGGYDLVTQASNGQVTVQEFNAAGQLLSLHAETEFSVASNGTVSVTGANDLIIGSGATVTLGSNATAALLHGNSDTVTLAHNDSLSLVGSSDTISLGSAALLNVNGGTSDTVTATNDTINTAANVSITLNGGGDTVNAASGDTVTITGVGQSSDNVVAMSNGTAIIANGVQADVNGNGNTINAGQNANFGIQGTNDVITTTGSGDNIWINSGNATISGGGNTIFAASETTVGVAGSNNSVVASNGTVSVNAGTSNITVQGGGETINFTGSSTLTVTGSSPNTVNLNGSNATFVDQTTTTNTIDVSAAGDVVHGNTDTVSLMTGAANDSIIGNNDTISAVSGVTFNVTGSGDTITASHATIYENASTTNITIDGSNDTIHIRSGDTYHINGSNDTVITDTVVTASNGTTIASYNGVSALVDITGLAFDSSIAAASVLNSGGYAAQIQVSDHGSVVDTINLQSVQNLGSFTLRSDGSGGTLVVDPPLPSSDASSSSSPPASDQGVVYQADTRTSFLGAARDFTANPTDTHRALADALNNIGSSNDLVWHGDTVGFGDSGQGVTGTAPIGTRPGAFDNAQSLLAQHMASLAGGDTAALANGSASISYDLSRPPGPSLVASGAHHGLA